MSYEHRCLDYRRSPWLASPYGVNFWSVFIAAVGAVVALLLWNAVMRRRPVT